MNREIVGNMMSIIPEGILHAAPDPELDAFCRDLASHRPLEVFSDGSVGRESARPIFGTQPDMMEAAFAQEAAPAPAPETKLAPVPVSPAGAEAKKSMGVIPTGVLAAQTQRSALQVCFTDLLE